MSPTLNTAPSAAEIRALTCPFQRVAAVTEVARRCGTLPTDLWQARRDALTEIRAIRTDDGGRRWSAAAIAARVGLSRARIFQLIRPIAEEA